ncbi:CsiV family protein [Azomonas macrocytogenes]|uniref:Peptidoglycan-binding protein CsiV n=1 Tax=Azomonas macrocytogenes TaxID=69962 RepID=A0A839SXA0_AZOMA|nr:CsiV family protein [Azomonas macrocytogenes]MBB3101742.1 hypothetical protein [Azomonas macrocytogenes]
MRLFLALLTLGSPLAQAEQFFHVELVFFRYTHAPLDNGQPAPDDWAQGTEPLAASNLQAPRLVQKTLGLTAEKGYTILLHKAWRQELSEIPVNIAVHGTNPRLELFPVQGKLRLNVTKQIDADASFWVNRFDTQGRLIGTESLIQKMRLLHSGELYYLDHGSLGLLIQVTRL